MVRRYAAKQLTERDLCLMLWIGQAGVAAADQIHRHFWADRHAQTAQDRLAQLVKAGYLHMALCDIRRQEGEWIYTLTTKGHQQFAPQERTHLRVGLPGPGELAQQLLAQEAYLHLAAEIHAQGGELVAWHAERDLRSAFRRAQRRADHQHTALPDWEIPDAQAIITTQNGNTLELDIEIDGQYYGQMLRQKAARFGAGGRPTLWVCTPARARIIQRVTQLYTNIRVLVVR
jgi:hypothetical protein